jgi:hypothetical protein
VVRETGVFLFVAKKPQIGTPNSKNPTKNSGILLGLDKTVDWRYTNETGKAILLTRTLRKS